MNVLVNTHHTWLDEKIRGYIASFIEITQGRISRALFYTDVKDLDKVPSKDRLTYIFCNPTDTDEAILYKASPRFMLSFFQNVECWTRKDRLAALVEYWRSKRPDSSLSNSIPETVHFELDYADFLEDKLDEPDLCYLKQVLLENEQKRAEDRDWWILKPAMTDCGYGIRLFSRFQDLEAIFEKCEDDGADEVAEMQDGLHDVEQTNGRLRSSILRSFVAQRYVASVPLLDSRKFHVRAYVLTMGRLRVFVHRELLILVSPHEYRQPWQPNALPTALTNTSLQGAKAVDGSRRRYWTSFENETWKQQTFKQICQVAADVFEAGVAGTACHFSQHPHCFDFFAADFLVDRSGKVWLLEVNAGPNINTDGEAGEIAQQVYKDVVYTTLEQLTGETVPGATGLVQVLSKDLGSNIPGFGSQASQL